MALLIPSRRRFLLGLGSLIAAPAVLQASSLMPVSSINLPKLKFVSVVGPEAGTIFEVAGTAPSWMIPCDGRLVSGLEYPDLVRAVRPCLWEGYDLRPNIADEWIHIWHEDGHEDNTPETVDTFVGVSAVEWTDERIVL